MVEKVLLKLSSVARSSASICSLNQLWVSGSIAPAQRFIANRLTSATVGRCAIAPPANNSALAPVTNAASRAPRSRASIPNRTTASAPTIRATVNRQ